MDHNEMSRKGGQAKSAAKTKAARENAKKPRKERPLYAYVIMKEGNSPARGLSLSPHCVRYSKSDASDTVDELNKRATKCFYWSKKVRAT